MIEGIFGKFSRLGDSVIIRPPIPVRTITQASNEGVIAKYVCVVPFNRFDVNRQMETSVSFPEAHEVYSPEIEP